MTVHGGQDAVEVGYCQQGRGAPADIYRVEGGESVAVSPRLPIQGVDEPRRAPRLGSGIEMAIGAFGLAEGDVDIEAGGHIHLS